MRALERAQQTVVSQHCCLFFAQVATEATFTIVKESALWYKFGVELWAVVAIREERRAGIPVLMCSSLFGMGNMITVEFAEEARFFLQRVIVWIASIAAMFHLLGSETMVQ